MDKRLILFALLLCGAVPSFARNDDHGSYASYQAPRLPEVRFDQFRRYRNEFVEGGVKGDYIKQPTFFNILGNIAVNFTPASLVADSRDLIANLSSSYRTGFKEHKADVALAAGGFAPVLGETKKFKQAFEAGKEARKVQLLGDLRFVAKSLPALRSDYVNAFDGKIVARTFQKGEFIYRSPQKLELELARDPGRWFGINAVSTRKMNEVFYKIEQYGNPNLYVRRYEVVEPFTAYYGGVKGGIGQQLLIPDNIRPGAVLKWRATERLK